MRQLPEDVVRRLASIDTPTLSNAIERLGVRHPTEGYMGPEIRCMFPELGPMIGHVVTVTVDTTTPGKTGVNLCAEVLRAVEASIAAQRSAAEQAARESAPGRERVLTPTESADEA